MNRRSFFKSIAAIAVAAAIPTPEKKPEKKVQSRQTAYWSREAAADLRAMHNIEAENELTALLAEEISREIDKEVLKDLRKLAA